ncbi:MAG: DUF4340 domain-containing protein [Bacteroidia bacterium]|nr:DUF4340 domain-containing protein [Bacteroidia bacterium]
MKKNRVYYIIIIVLLVIAGYLIFSQRWGTIRKELRDFAVEDTASVTKIFMVDKANQHVTLVRENSRWTVNRKYTARKDAIDILLKTLNRIDIKAPVPKAAFENVVKNMAAQSVKVEIYQGKDQPSKTLYVGGSTQDQTGTYVMLENSSTPFVCHIPGFSGYLTTRFFINETDWRDRSICHYRFNDIASITLVSGNDPDKSFTIINSGNNQFRLLTYPGKKDIRHFDTLAVKDYIASSRRLAFEYITHMSRQQVDSVLEFEPVQTIILEDVNKKQTVIKTFYRPNKGLIDTNGELYPYDADRMFAQINNNKEIVVIQYLTFNSLFRIIDDFEK